MTPYLYSPRNVYFSERFQKSSRISAIVVSECMHSRYGKDEEFIARNMNTKQLVRCVAQLMNEADD